MKNVCIALQLYNGDPTTLQWFKPVGTHLIFDIKLGENFRQKARCVRNGHRTATPSFGTYSTVVSRNSAWIGL